MTVRSTPDPWAPVRGQRAVMLTTYRRDGRSVATPVGYGIDGATLYFMTDPGTGKVKRLRHTATVTLAASTLRGAVKGPAVTGVATEITGAEADQGRRRDHLDQPTGLVLPAAQGAPGGLGLGRLRRTA